jgi:hypothetical protein
MTMRSKPGATPEALASLAEQACDLWSGVVVACGGFEAVAREQIVSPSQGHRLQSLHQAWTEFNEWRSRSDDASARSQLFAALAAAHLDNAPAPARTVVKLDAVQLTGRWAITHITHAGAPDRLVTLGDDWTK